MFIDEEIKRMLEEGIVERSSSPWRAQIVIVKRKGKKLRLTIDYSTTINFFTYTQAYLIPKISGLINQIASNSYFSTLDLKSAYHQIPLEEKDRHYTAFEANGKLYQFRRLAFGLTNAGSVFQELMQNIIDIHELGNTFAYLDDVIVCGKTKKEHDENLKKFMDVARSINITLNHDKCEFSQTKIKILGYYISKGEVKPDFDRMQGLRDYKLPTNKVQLRSLKGLLGYYAKWIPNYSDKVKSLSKPDFPLSETHGKIIEDIIKELETVTLQNIDFKLPFTLHTDASDVAIALTLMQKVDDSLKPCAFFSRMLHKHELNYSVIEKESVASIESIRRWRYLLTFQPFTLCTDQRSLSFMMRENHESKIKNKKIARWRLEMQDLKYKLVYKAGRDNVVADALSRDKIDTTLISKDKMKKKDKIKNELKSDKSLDGKSETLSLPNSLSQVKEEKTAEKEDNSKSDLSIVDIDTNNNLFSRKKSILKSYRKRNKIGKEKSLKFSKDSFIIETDGCRQRIDTKISEVSEVPKRNFSDARKAYLSSWKNSAILIKQAHRQFGHVGVAKMVPLLKSLNIFAQVEQVRKVLADCQICAQLKPRFSKLSKGTLIKTQKPFERLSLDIKGPVNSSQRGFRFILVVVDEYSRFVWGYPLKDISTDSVIERLESLFAYFGYPLTIHTDNGSNFVSAKMKSYFYATHSSIYHPQGNGRVGTIWKSVPLHQKDDKSEIGGWNHYSFYQFYY